MTHAVLQRQLRRLGLDAASPPRDAASWAELLRRVGAAYAAADQERYLLERSFTLSSAEMQEIYANLRVREAEQAALRRVATAVAADAEPEEVFNLAARESAMVVGADGGRVLRFEGERAYMVGTWGRTPELARSGTEEQGIRLGGATATARVFQTGAPSRVDDYGAVDDEAAAALAERRFRSGVAAPIHVRGRLWGTVAAMTTSADGLPEFAENSFAEFAGLVALAIASSTVRAELARRAMTDPLTGLPNRPLFDDRLEQAIRRRRRDGGRMAVLLMDLDRFKDVNDTLGHGSGDALLRDIAERLRVAIREGDTLARLGGDEFAVVLSECADQAAAMFVAEKLRAALGASFALDGLLLDVHASVGVAVFPEHGTTPEALVKHADVAMYAAKEARSGQMAYSAAYDEHTPERLALVAELRRAIDKAELEVHYQPKVDLRTNRVIGVEALVRWRHPERGLLLPGAFIPIVEHTALMRPLTFAVLDQCLARCREWEAAGLELPASVNVSASGLADLSLPRAVGDALDRAGLPPDRLEFEITESALMVDPLRTLSVLRELHELGVRIAIDDFGTGYSSLAYLKDLPVDTLKIDRSFVARMEVSRTDAMIVRSVVELAHNLGLTTVAEGVEEAAHIIDLRALGCDAAQGYLIARPIPADDVSRWVRSWDPEALSDGGQESVGGLGGAGRARP